MKQIAYFDFFKGKEKKISYLHSGQEVTVKYNSSSLTIISTISKLLHFKQTAISKASTAIVHHTMDDDKTEVLSFNSHLCTISH